MKQSMVADEALKLARQVADDQRVEVLEVRLLGRGKGALLRVTIDRSGGVTLDDCERFSRSLGLLLDAEDSLQGPYNLEVSSPGLDRPLTVLKDFERHKGKLVRIITKNKIDNQNFFQAKIGVLDDDLRLLDRRGVFRNNTIDKITMSRLEIEIK